MLDALIFYYLIIFISKQWRSHNFNTTKHNVYSNDLHEIFIVKIMKIKKFFKLKSNNLNTFFIFRA